MKKLIHKNLFLFLSTTTVYCEKITLPESINENLRYNTQAHLITYVGSSKFRFAGETSLKATYSITNPGTYILTDDITSSIDDGAESIVYINSNDVIFDMSGHSITHNSSGSTDIIKINAGKKNTIIRNGTLTGSKLYGIFAGNNCTNITCENLLIQRADTAGIGLIGTSGNELKNCTLKNCMITDCDGGANADAVALKLDYCNYLTAIDSSFNTSNTTTDTYDAYGILATNSQGCTFVNCTMNGHEGETIAAGSYITTCTGFTFKNCSAHYNISTDTTASQAYGFYVNDSNETFFENCSATFNSSVNTTAGFMVNASRNNRFINCIANGNQVTGSLSGDRAYGFGVGTYENFNHRFENCTAMGTKGGTNSSSRGAGFSLEYSNFCILLDCNSDSNGGTAGFGIGIDLLTTCTVSVIQDCKLSANTSTTAGQGIGINDAASNSANLLINNFAFGNRDTTGAPTNTNYNLQHSSSNVIQEVTLINVAGISLASPDNISINPD